MGPYYRACIEQFGADRCMFESNFPVDRASCSYTVQWNAFKRLTVAYSKAERAALFHNTASRIYRPASSFWRCMSLSCYHSRLLNLVQNCQTDCKQKFCTSVDFWQQSGS